MREIVIKENEAGQRFDKFLKKYLSEATGGFLYKMLRKKNIVLNGKKATGNEKLNCGDTVKFFLSDETIDKFSGNQKTSAPYENMPDLALPSVTVWIETQAVSLPPEKVLPDFRN